MTRILLFFRALLLRNKGIKVLALILAVVSWYAIRGAISFETLVSNVPLTIRLAEGWAVLDRSTDAVDVLFQGSRDELLRLNRENVEVVVDLTGRENAGTLEISLDPRLVVAPGTARARAIQPGEVTIQLDRQSVREVPVKVDVQGSPPEGFEMGMAVADPVAVQVSGPKQRVDAMKWVRTEPVSMDGRRQSFRERVELVQPGEGWQARLMPARVNARVTINERSESRLFRGVPVEALINPAQEGITVAVKPLSVDLTIKGVEGRLQAVDKKRLRAYIDCSTLVPGSRYELPVQVILPDGISLDAIEPASVNITISSN
jgi:YbbR domain-containing protein